MNKWINGLYSPDYNVVEHISASGHLVLVTNHSGEKVKTVTDCIFLGSKITAIVTSATKLKDTCSLEEKLRQT